MKYRATILEQMDQMKNEEPLMVTNSYGSCMVTTSSYDETLKPIFQASYPASGSEMLRQLTESLTGISTGVGKRRDDVVAIKTYLHRKVQAILVIFSQILMSLIQKYSSNIRGKAAN